MAAGRFDGFAKQGSDAAVEGMIEEHCRRYEIDALDAVKMFTILSRRQWLKRFLAHVEMFKLTLDVPGDIAEVGVFRGHGLFTWANLLESYCIGDRTKVVYGFDNWSGFSELAPEDGAIVKELEKQPGGFSPQAFYDELRSALEIFDADRFIPWKGRVKLIEGNVEETAARFTEENLGVRFMGPSLKREPLSSGMTEPVSAAAHPPRDGINCEGDEERDGFGSARRKETRQGHPL